MLNKLSVCYAAYFQNSYRPCDGWLLAEVIMGVCVVAALFTIARAIAKKAKH